MAAAERGEYPAAAWAAIEEAALHRALVPEAAGGFGVPVLDALAMLRVAAQHALPLPLAETMFASYLLAGAGLEIPDGALTLTADPSTDPAKNGHRLAAYRPRRRSRLGPRRGRDRGAGRT